MLLEFWSSILPISHGVIDKLYYICRVSCLLSYYIMPCKKGLCAAGFVFLEFSTIDKSLVKHSIGHAMDTINSPCIFE